MQFTLVDRIVELTRGSRIVTIKAVSLAEEYLADHFPTFPVLPGVLMLEALVESARWLVHDAQDFSNGLILLRRASNVTYKSFVKPGNLLRLEVECRGLDRDASRFSGVGFCNDRETVRARFELWHGAGRRPDDVDPLVDQQVRAEARRRFALLQTGVL